MIVCERFSLNSSLVSNPLIPEDSTSTMKWKSFLKEDPTEWLLEKENVESLCRIFENILDKLDSKEISRSQVLRNSLITPACGLGLQTEENARRAASMCAEISKYLREKYIN